ncbi:hypothetical protein D1AOALGA4SA_7212 [Olavius algarvensis Delta 1 endosymbiont]|nr:hypothetical protein D1AOALGA4SA_7212 [Olavius algarvensis Delta 1 endosymbiont]
MPVAHLKDKKIFQICTAYPGAGEPTISRFKCAIFFRNAKNEFW